MLGCPGDETLLVLVVGSLARTRELEVKRHTAVTETMNPATRRSGA